MKHYKNIMTHLSGIVEDMGTYRGIQEICILFPTMKPMGEAKRETDAASKISRVAETPEAEP